MTENSKLPTDVSSSSSMVVLTTSTAAKTIEKISASSAALARDAETSNATLEKAIYNYIRAIRALGRTTVNTVEIAQALHIPLSAVGSALSALKKKGVKVAA